MALDTEFGAYIPTTDVYDTDIISRLNVNDPELKDFLVRLYQTTNNLRVAINLREAGLYPEESFVCGKLWFENPNLSSTTPQLPQYRQVYRKTINFGQLPNATSKSVAHGLTADSELKFTHIYATASDTTGNTYIPVPNSEILVDATNVTITTTVDKTAYDICYVVLEYIQE